MEAVVQVVIRVVAVVLGIGFDECLSECAVVRPTTFALLSLSDDRHKNE